MLLLAFQLLPSSLGFGQWVGIEPRPAEWHAITGSPVHQFLKILQSTNIQLSGMCCFWSQFSTWLLHVLWKVSSLFDLKFTILLRTLLQIGINKWGRSITQPPLCVSNKSTIVTSYLPLFLLCFTQCAPSCPRVPYGLPLSLHGLHFLFLLFVVLVVN